MVTWHQCEESINNSLLIELRGSDSATRFLDVNSENGSTGNVSEKLGKIEKEVLSESMN